METLTIYGNVNIIDDYSYENNINDDDVYDIKDTGYIFRFAKNLVEREFISQGMEEFFKKEYEKDGLASVNFELSREKNKSILTMTQIHLSTKMKMMKKYTMMNMMIM